MYPHEAEWTPFQTHYFSENLLTPGIEPGTLSSVVNSVHYFPCGLIDADFCAVLLIIVTAA
jgi:hypothetical protein